MRIFCAPLAAGDVAVRGEEHHYVSRVRRARVGDAIELVDGAGMRARGTIVAISDSETIVRVEAVEAVIDGKPWVRVLVPLIKGDRMDTCIEKLVEVGADEIVLWPAARAVVKLDGQRLVSRVEHYQALAQAAARQSGRVAVPAVSAKASLADAIGTLPTVTAAVRLGDAGELAAARVVLDPAAERGEWPSAADITLISGPEGGLAPAEHDALAAASFISLGLGPRVLRAETAPMIAVALLRAATQS